MSNTPETDVKTEAGSRQEQAMEIVKVSMAWSCGAGLIPMPLLDMAAIAAVQVRMLQNLAAFYDIPFKKNVAKSLVASLLGGTGAFLVAGPLGSLVKIVPLVGPLASIVVSPAAAAATTYAVGKVFIQHFESGGTFLNLNPDEVRKYYYAERDKADGKAEAA